MGDDACQLRWRWLYDLPSDEQGGFEGRLICHLV
jgi:hypothetical protein